MTDQYPTTSDQSTQMPKRNGNRDHLNRAMLAYLESGEIYQTSQEVHDGLRKAGCVHLMRDPEKAHQAVRRRLVQNSAHYGKREDEAFYLKRRLRNM